MSILNIYIYIMTDHHIRNVGTSQVHKINTDMLKLSDKYLKREVAIKRSVLTHVFNNIKMPNDKKDPPFD